MKLDKSMAAIVTGGASGLGAATARMLAAEGAKVAIFDMNAERGEAVARETGGIFCHADVTDEASIDAALEKARAAHGIERILVNCAGIAPGKTHGDQEARDRRADRPRPRELPPHHRDQSHRHLCDDRQMRGRDGGRSTR